jgi:hypothetical protein
VRSTPVAVALTAALALTACGGADSQELSPAANAGSPSASASSAADAYTVGSDVTAHAAVGRDLEQVRELLAPAKDGGEVDWAAVGTLFREGSGASVKGDGSVRTLAGLAPDSAAVALVDSAVAGVDPSLSDAARAQQVDKGIVVAMTEKVMTELDDAAKKVAAGETDAEKGAPHDVDEAYAFFVAEGHGPATTADKREKDELVGKVRAPVVDALSAAQQAAAAGDAAALATATEQVRSALDHVFYLAVHRYLEHEGDEVKLAEGSAFYLGIAPRVEAAAPAAHQAVLDTLAGGDTATGRDALSSPEVLTALGLTDEQRIG